VGDLPHEALIALYKRSKYFVHLAWLDHCPNVVVDARASGCRIVCATAGGTKEIAGKNAIVLQEEEWNFEPLDLYSPPEIDFDNMLDNDENKGYNIDMNMVMLKYRKFIESLDENS
jgi:glycosyltransferase involved in cell wall biosynthesis